MKKTSNSSKTHKPTMMFLRWIGKTPSVDWLILSVLFVCFILIVAVWSTLYFLDVKSELAKNLQAVSAAPAPITETQEEQLRAIIGVYEKKKADHQALLGKTKIDTAAEAKSNPVIATSTATSTATTSSANRPAAGTASSTAR